MSLKLTSKGACQKLEQIIHLFENTLDELSPAISLRRDEEGSWVLEIYFNSDLDKKILAERITPLFGDTVYSLEVLPDINWVSQTQKSLKPVTAGRYFVHGAHDQKSAPSNALKILIEAGTAFGTGHHGTTKACLLALDHIHKRFDPQSMLDLGCGSGILAIAAAKTFKAPVIASDIDPESVKVSQHNSRHNQTARLVTVLKSTGFHYVKIAKYAPYDLIFANILAKPLCAMANDMKKHTLQGSRLILSGMLTHQGRRVEATYRAHGFFLEKRIIFGEWLTLILFRK